MPATRLTIKRVEKPWGRRTLWPGFDDVEGDGPPVGEVWFEAPKDVDGKDPELLIKYLFTSERLSVQDHPDDASARKAGYPRGKDEAWVILGADPHATIAIGMLAPMSRDELRESALDGSIVAKLDWKAVKKDDFYYSPAGTVHAIGPGLTVVEIQQNVDLTYRLYDYGSDRELHLDAGIAVADPVPYVASFVPYDAAPGRTILAAGPKFVQERWSLSGDGTFDPGTHPAWLVPLAGTGTIDGDPLEAGGAWLARGTASLTLDAGTDLLVSYPGDEVVDAIWARA